MGSRVLQVHEAVDVSRSGHVPGEPALWGVIFADMMVFTGLFTVFLVKRGAQGGVFADAQRHLDPDLAALNTLVLLTSSLLVVLAVRALRVGRRSAASGLVRGAGLLGVCFIVVKCLEYHHLLSRGLDPSVNEFYLYYFVLTGLHVAHLVVGLLVLAGLDWVSRRDHVTAGQLVLVEGGACFWHMVDLLWILIFPLLFLVR